MLKRIVLTAALIAGMASPALAHRGHGGLTVIEIDPGSGAVSVSHRFAAHDVEPALPSIAPEPGSISITVSPPCPRWARAGD